MVTVCLTFDFDAVSSWLHMDGGSRNSPTNRSRGVFGAEVGAPRILDVLERRDVPSTWFVPGHTLDSFPDVAGDIADGGHEIQHHGWSHIPPGDYENADAERADLERGIESVRAVTGERPIGYRSPSWDYSEHTVDLLLDLGFEWSSSGMASEFEPYYARRDVAPADGPYDPGEETDLLEVPVSWHRDDYPPLAFSPKRASVAAESVYQSWREQFDWLREHSTASEEVFVLTMHPQVTGRSDLVAKLDGLIGDVLEAPDARLASVSTVAAAFRQ